MLNLFKLFKNKEVPEFLVLLYCQTKNLKKKLELCAKIQ